MPERCHAAGIASPSMLSISVGEELCADREEPPDLLSPPPPPPNIRDEDGDKMAAEEPTESSFDERI